MAKVDSALRIYPYEQRLVQFRASLGKDESEQQVRKQRNDDLVELRSLCNRAERAEDPNTVDSILAESILFSDRHVGDREFDSLSQTIRQRAARTLEIQAPPVKIAHVEAVAQAVGKLQVAELPQVVPLEESRIQDSVLYTTGDWLANDFSSDGRPPKGPALSVQHEMPEGPEVPVLTPWRFSQKWAAAVGIALLVVILLGLGVWRLKHQSPSTGSQKLQTSVPATYPLPVKISVPNGQIQVDGKPASLPLRLSAGTHTLAVSAPGFVSTSQTIAVGPNMSTIAVSLTPEPQRLDIYAPDQPAHVAMDGNDAGLLQAGQFSKDDLAFGEHTIAVTNGPREILKLHFSATAAQAPRLLDPVRNNIAVIALFGSSGKIYSGSKLLLQSKNGGQQAIPAEGLPIDAEDGDLLVTDGQRPQTLSIQHGNYPQLSIYVMGDADSRPLLAISTNVDDAQLLINAKPKNWREYKGKLRGRLEPGEYTIRLEKQGYEPGEVNVKLAKSDKKPIELNLKPLPVVGKIEIEGGVPETTVLIDGAAKGALDANGQLTVSQLAPGNHTISFVKENYETRRYIKNVSASQTLRIPAAEAHLIPYGSLTFRIVPAGAVITYRRREESEWHEAQNNQTVALPEGRYVVRAEMPEYAPEEQTYDLAPADKPVIRFQLKSTQTNAQPTHVADSLQEVEDASKWRKDGGWITYEGQGYGWTRLSQGKFSVDFRKRSNNPFSRGNTFVIGFADNGKHRVEYRISKDGWLTRKLSTDRGTEDSHRTERVPGDDYYRLLITIEPHRVVVRNASGAVLDDCQTDFDLSAGKFGFKSGYLLQLLRQ
jgi:hypothetical protein